MNGRLALIVTGDRHASVEWIDTVRLVLGRLVVGRYQVVLIHGAANGIDSIAANEAQSYWSVIPMDAPWDEFAKMGRRNAAGPFRNEQMLTVLRSLGRVGYETMVLAFHDDIEASKGTKNMVEIALAVDVPVRIIGSDGREQ